MLTEIPLRALVSSILLLSSFCRSRRTAISSEPKSRAVVLTGTFFSENWLLTHIVPLVRSREIDRVFMVANACVPDYPGVVGLYPRKTAEKFFGKTLARLFCFFMFVRKEKPLYAGGFHLLLNGLVALLASSVAGVRSLYICGGGPREVEGGGYKTENRLFRRLQLPSDSIERSLIEAVNRMDLTIVMGESAKTYFESKGVMSHIEVNPGGIDPSEFFDKHAEKTFDVIFVGRISAVKRVDVFLSMVEILLARLGSISAVIVGDGPLAKEMRSLAENLGISEHTNFVGWTNDVGYWLSRSKVFVMTSESEGLSQALIQAALCGLPSVVSDVGDLSDLVENGKNGFLITHAEAMEFALKVELLLGDNEFYKQSSRLSTEISSRYTVDSAAESWNRVLTT